MAHKTLHIFQNRYEKEKPLANMLDLKYSLSVESRTSKGEYTGEQLWSIVILPRDCHICYWEGY